MGGFGLLAVMSFLQVAIYFAFLGMYTQWLIFPAVLGIILNLTDQGLVAELPNSNWIYAQVIHFLFQTNVKDISIRILQIKKEVGILNCCRFRGVLNKDSEAFLML